MSDSGSVCVSGVTWLMLSDSSVSDGVLGFMSDWFCLYFCVLGCDLANVVRQLCVSDGVLGFMSDWGLSVLVFQDVTWLM